MIITWHAGQIWPLATRAPDEPDNGSSTPCMVLLSVPGSPDALALEGTRDELIAFVYRLLHAVLPLPFDMRGRHPDIVLFDDTEDDEK